MNLDLPETDSKYTEKQNIILENNLMSINTADMKFRELKIEESEIDFDEESDSS